MPIAGTVIPAATTVNASANYTFSGTGSISGSGALNKQGTGTLIIANSGANDFTGTTTISGGVLQVGDGTNGKLGSGPVVNNASLVLQMTDSTFANIVSGTGNLTKAGNSTIALTGANTHTGATIVSAGTLSIASFSNGGIASPLGAGANTPDKLVLDSGTLRYTGPAATTDRLFSIGLNGSLEASGTGALVFGNTGALGFSGTGARTFTLKGTSTGNNQLNSSIRNEAGGATTVVKEGPGTWVLNGANQFSGGVTVNGGVLAVDGNQNNDRVPAGNLVTVNNTGTFEVRGVNAIPGGAALNMNINQGGILRVVTGFSASSPGGGSHLHVGTLTLSGATVDLTYSGTGTAYNDESFQLDGDIVVTGTAPSVVNTTLPITQQGIAPRATRTFTVNDVTASSASDFIVNAELENSDAGNSGILKDGAGTMQLTKQNTFTGGLTINAGAVLIDGNTANMLANNSMVTVQNAGTFDLRGVNALPTGGASIDLTANAGGTIRIQSGGSTAIGAAGNSHHHIRNVTMNGGTIDLFYSGTGTAYNTESFQLNGNMTIGGSAMSTINISGGATLANQGIALLGTRTFTVANATAGTDLKVFAELENSDTTPADDGVSKSGPGTLEIAGESTYSGPTIVNEGSLWVTGMLNGTNGVSVTGGASFGGTGRVTPSGTGAINLSSGAFFAPGADGIGTLTVDGANSTALNLLAFLPDAVLTFDLGATSGDAVALVNGAANDVYFGGNLLTLAGTPGLQKYTIFTSDVAAAYEGLVMDGSGIIIAGLILDPSFTTLNPAANLRVEGNNIVLNVPEPGSALMLLGGLGILAGRRMRKQKQA